MKRLLRFAEKNKLQKLPRIVLFAVAIGAIPDLRVSLPTHICMWWTDQEAYRQSERSPHLPK